MKKINILLIIIVFVAAGLRLWQLGAVPTSPDWDEAALGYNAYSIMQTGRDEYGKLFPVVLQSFNDYKPALYVYLAIPSIFIFDLNTFAVRLPSAIFGILTVLATYFLLKELFAKNPKSEIRNPKQIQNSNNENIKDLLENGKWKMEIPLIATALLAISPWHIQFSRVAFESNIGLAFNVFAALFFLKGLKNPWFLSLSTASAAMSIYAYQSEKIFTPLFLIILIIIYRKELFSVSKKYLYSSVLIGILVLLPTIQYFMTNENAFARAKGVSIFSSQTHVNQGERKRYIDDAMQGDTIGLFLHNKYISYGKEMIYGYTAHFSPNWLFIRGDLERHHAPGMSLLYLWELPFLLVGFYMLLFGPFSKKTKIFIFSWFLLAPFPASLSTGVPHAVRTLNFLPTWQIFTAIGLIISYGYISKIKYEIAKIPLKYILFSLYISFFIFNFSYYINQYFVQQNYYYSKSWQYGYEDVVSYVQKEESKYDKIIVSNKTPLDQSYMFFLFYMKYPPTLYQSKQSSFGDSHMFDKYEFRTFDYTKERNNRTLFIGIPQDFPDHIEITKKIRYLNGDIAIYIVKG
jgi:4-amino-4-deoxy-L-arabinose transferase-like glycosyltransferase